MGWMRILLSRCAGFWGGKKLDDDLDEELRSHLEFAIEENLKRGMGEQQARREALRQFGGVTQTRERYRAQRGLPFVENLWRDIRFGLRQLRKSPGFTLAAVLTLALGIGATSAMFSVIDAVVLRPLPYHDVNRIVCVNLKAHTFEGLSPQEVSWPEYQDMRRLNTTFSALAGVSTGRGVTGHGVTLTQGDRAVYLAATEGTDNFFAVFGVAPLLGRTYLPGEDQNGRNNVVVLSYGVWQQDFGGQRSVLGKTVHLDDAQYTIIGVMPAGFHYPVGVENAVYTPLHLSAEQIRSRGAHWLDTIGRLRPGVTTAQANSDLAHVMKELSQQYPVTDRDRVAELVPITDAIHVHSSGRDDRPELWVLLAAVFAVLLIACTNIAGLLLARGVSRKREMAMRAALGAGRGRLTGQLLSESMMLGMGGGVCGIAVAGLLLAAMKQFLERAFARGGDANLNLRVLSATFVLALLTSVAAGLLPAWRAARTDPIQALKSGGGAGTTLHQYRLRAGFVAGQLALSLMLLVCCGLVLLGLRSMLQTNLGFNPKNLLTLQVDIPRGNYAGRDFVKALVEPLEARVQAIPGVTAVGSNNLLPIRKSGLASDLGLVGEPADPPGHERFSKLRFITPGYFRAMQLPILQGRNFTGQDASKTQSVAIVNEAWVKEFLPQGGDPLTHAFDNGADSPSTAIVGVSGSGRQNIFEPTQAEIDFPISQLPDYLRAFVPSFYLFVRTTVTPASIVPQLREALHKVSPDIAFRTPEKMEDVLSDALVANRMQSWLFGLFAGLAVLLTVVGIYGLLMQEVVSQTRDIGVRMALGATRMQIVQKMLLRLGALLGIGLGAGICLTLLLRRVAGSILAIQFAHDSELIAGLVALLAVIGLLAAVAPLRRAASVDPMRTLRME